ncbi:unnamed protein product [Clonostachys chloroleuca]|uniref:Beta-lactamase-related domain-containing protein n=1 Tax=Clonostachys chloroleuca TaxID=1926264 RepID=A0AA35Q8C1_9HYPO|nr:unnamed protein product [Clonostachys chloroleuca]
MASPEQNEQKPSDEQSSAKSTNPFNDEFAQFAKETLEQWKVPGVSLAVIDGDQVYAEGYGFASLPDTPATPETVWYAASTTKAFTAAALAHIIAEKKYPALSKGWSTKISSIIRDDFVLQDDWMTQNLNLEDAVCHRTGMPRHDMANHREDEKGNKLWPRDVVRNLRNLKVTGEPRAKFMYCNIMYVVLSHVIETLEGKGLGEVLKEQIWEPLDMVSTSFSPEDAKKSGPIASGYHWDRKAEKYIPLEEMATNEISGAGAMLSTVLDYTKWLKCLLHEEAPFSKDTHKDIRTPRIVGAMPNGAKDVNMYGLGWERTIYRGHILHAHSGGMHAFGSQVYWLPEHKFGVVAFGNTLLSSNAAEDVLCYKLINDKLGLPEEDRHDYNKHWRDLLDGAAKSNEGVLDRLYPDRPNPALPPSLQTGCFVGTYEDAGYGSFTLREEPHPDKPGETILVADRPRTTWRYVMKMHHVTGDYWMIYTELQGVADAIANSTVGGQFKIGVDGKVSSLDIYWENYLGPATDGGVVSFKKTE